MESRQGQYDGKKPLSFTDYVRSICSTIVFSLFLLLYTPVVIVLLLLSLGRLTNFIIEKLVPPIGLICLWIAGIRFRVKWQCDPLPEAGVYIFNHSSTVDVLTILAAGFRRIRFVAKWEFQYNPLFILLGRLTGQIFIKRDNSAGAVKTLKKAQNRIKRQRLSLLMAPEGSRKHPGIIGPFKKGPFRMAMDLGYPLIPVYFEGNRKLSEGRTLVTRSGECTAHIHTPIDTSGWKLDELNRHIADVRESYLKWAAAEEGESPGWAEPENKLQ